MAAAIAFAPPAAGNGENLFLDCPCRVASDGTTLTIAFGVRSFRSAASGRVRVAVLAKNDWGRYEEVAGTGVAAALAAGSRLTRKRYEATLDAGLTGVRSIRLQLEEERAGDWERQDTVRMELPVDMSEPFDLRERDYLKDTDGDGVSDINERLASTDPDDADSTPGRSKIDVVSLYTDGYSGRFADPTTHIQHQFAVTNTIFADSKVDIRVRLVGVVPVTIEGEEDYANEVDEGTVRMATESHGADLNVLFRERPPSAGYGAWAFATGGMGARGDIVEDLERYGGVYATLTHTAHASTLAHELGHVMGLGHAVWQNSVGAWRWSRGHGVASDFRTVMASGGSGSRLALFSSPAATCRGALDRDEPCGVSWEQPDAADAVTTLNAVRFQVAGLRTGYRDSDGDGFVDPVDDLPNDRAEWLDTDGDGVGNNADADDDGDGVADRTDAFPLDASEARDQDGDGVGDNADAFPRDASETADTDEDGVGDNADAFPNDPAETADSDGDGVGDNGDPFPNDPRESADTDGDGIGDNADPDADGDGIADTLDLFPLDPERSDVASYQFVGEHLDDGAGKAVAATADGTALLIGAPDHDADERRERGAAYLVSTSDLPALDAADGAKDRVVQVVNVPKGRASWKFVGEGQWEDAGEDVAVGDLDGDGAVDAVIGAIDHWCSGRRCGAVYVVSGADFAAADAADGAADHTIALANIAAQPNSWRIRGEADDLLGLAIAILNDMDNDGQRDIAIGAPGQYWEEDPIAGSIYMLVSGGFAAGDRADGTRDGTIDLRQFRALTGSWKLVGESPGDMAGYALAALPDLDGDGNAELLVGAPYRDIGDARDAGAAYVVSSAGLAAADRADGQRDRVVALKQATSKPRSWRLLGTQPRQRLGWATAAAADDGQTWLLLGGVQTLLVDAKALAASGGDVDLSGMSRGHALELPQADAGAFIADSGGGSALALTRRWASRASGPYGGGRAYVLSAPGWQASGNDHGSLSRDEIVAAGWTIAGARAFEGLGAALAATGDVDGDGVGEILVGTSANSSEVTRAGTAYLLLSADLAALDRADGTVDGAMHVGDMAGDADGDGLGNSMDLDDDGDGVLDTFDVFPLNPSEWADADGDGFGDRSDAFPFDRNEAFDTDADGIGDNADNDDDGDGIADRDDPRPRDTDDDGQPNREDADDDNDGTPDAEDACPVDANETVDTDGDGICDNADRDDDNDGTPDWRDAFPVDPTESSDQDEDGTGDNADAFPEDPEEQADTDGDGIGNNADTDDDNDGVPDSRDAFPLDATAKRDRDGDGVSDREDAFPLDAAESVDTDGDGVGDNADRDDDGDGVADFRDRFPLDATRTGLRSVRFVAEGEDERLGASVASVGDLDADGLSDIAISATEHGEWGAVYVVSGSQLQPLDEIDGVRGGTVELSRVASRRDSWKLLGEVEFAAGSALAPLGNFGDAATELLAVGSAAYGRSGGGVGGAYVISPLSLPAIDALDGAADGVAGLGHVAPQSGSWTLIGRYKGNIGRNGTIARFGTNMLIGQPKDGGGEKPGDVHVLEADALAAFDALDGDADGTIDLGDVEPTYVGEAASDEAGASLAAADFDGDGAPDAVIGAPGHGAAGAVYLIGSRDAGSPMSLADIAARRHSWKFVGGAVGSEAGRVVATGDVDGDGQPDLLVGEGGGVRVLSGTQDNFIRLDRADGDRDGVVDISANSRRIRAWNATPTEEWTPGSLATLDVDGDGRSDVLMGKDRSGRPEVVAELFLGTAFTDEDTEPVPSSYQFRTSATEIQWDTVTVATAGDTDADGLEDFLIGLPGHNDAYLINAADLDLLDANDGITDGLIHLSTVAGEERF